ncbi:TadE family protein [Actinomarinicola tropica]|uniref:Uncharacterized protein n=1 Tax=Actinomarinicola tropica TaxID=2789776 RepID=A0A5Q2RFT8_9ACTN|nr:TadE family protein [Actinomarinicola tropica]QGG95699.1 hypothetical protein GH723_11655 [Actinomarinicola tropica]
MRGTDASRGATLVEYALVFSLLVVLAIGAVEFLNAQSDAEINNQADCVSDRPPPGDCGFAPVPSDVTFPDPGYSPPTSAPPNAADVPTLTLGIGDHDTSTGWAVLLPVTLERPSNTDPPTPPEPVAGVRIRAEIRLRDPADATRDLDERGYTDCVTGADGSCTLRYDVPYTDVDNVKLRIIGVDSTPPAPVPAAVAEYDKP